MKNQVEMRQKLTWTHTHIERVPQEKEQQHMTSNPLVLTPITGRVHICTGCKVLFTNREHKQPHDLVFRIQMRRQYKKWAKENSY